MKENQTKRTIYVRTFSSLFTAYLILMIGFSIFLINKEKKVQELQFNSLALQINHTANNIIKDNITDFPKLKRKMIGSLSLYANSGTEIGIFTSNYNLIFNTNENWLCSYTESIEGNTHYTGYASLNPYDWFSDEDISELEGYLSSEPKVEKVGDLSGYILDIDGFWLKDEMIIPDRINVTPMYATKLSEDNGISSSSGSNVSKVFISNNNKATEDLPYFKIGSINPINKKNKDYTNLRNLASNKDKLEKTVKKFVGISIEKIGLFTYQYYYPVPYQNTIRSLTFDGKNFYSEYWTVCATEVNLLKLTYPTLIFVWISCFLTFFIAALIISTQSYKLYKRRDDLEKYRIETTNALAHDLKTPLSIISGYAENLIENVHTEKKDHYAANIQANVKRMDKIVLGMIELSKLESDSFKIKYEDVSLSEVCDKLINHYSPICDEKQIVINMEGDEVIKADFALMERVINNFFVNALEHTPNSGSINITINEDILEFYNSGSHIPEKELTEIWKPYKKVDSSRSNTKGTGLGLSISSKILELYNFSYGAKNYDNGVIFWFKW
ncbi:sensor histidine kinase [Clostridium intestinale]|uniref:histidine kinase n=1 Tax=Clostridium intestinale DSM 6191 TaxID=1121320 RepID=A0A1M5XPG9_9CLOT|nr:HAMP domain-containing sensor histidine kinase [Clostridium intestinale]SHI01701.1 Histidine kinase-, DNA gyrase B-, and HSP90-like ATPase [Clostridium intestinale DSM 6191]